MTALVALGCVGAASAQESHDNGSPTLVTDISVLPGTGAVTVLQIEVDANLVEQDVDLFKVSGGAPRVLIKLRGIERPYNPARFTVEDQNLIRVRTGFHPEHEEPQLHVVLDLTSTEVVIMDREIIGSRLLVSLGLPGATRGTMP